MPTAIIKCGGSILNELSDAFFISLKKLIKTGYDCVIVHGGGPDINEELEKLQIKREFYLGMRKTTPETLRIAEQILAGKTNRNLVALLDNQGIRAIGINGSDAKVLQAVKIDEANLGLVGEISAVNASFIKVLLKEDLLPVITPIAMSETGEKLNVNADYAAAAVAKSLQADQCLFVTDVAGINIGGRRTPQLNDVEIAAFIQTGEIYGGMIPKVQSAVTALANGVCGVRIVSGKESFFDGQNWSGTMVVKKERIAL